jgi:predicted dehydrogenase
METVNVGFIGCGGIAGAHMNNLSKMSDVKFVGMSDVDEVRAKKASETYGGTYFTDYKKMLNEIEMDVCYICLPPFAHQDQEISCIEKEVPFFIEKPIHLDLKKAKEISDRIKEKNLITSAGYQDRYQTIIDYIKPFFNENNLGFFEGWWVGGMPGVYWWRRKEMSGGQIVEQTTHIYDMARYLISEPVEVFSVKRTGLMKDIEKYNVEDASAVSVYFQNGVFGTIFSGCFINATGKVGLDFYFKDKKISYEERSNLEIHYGKKIEKIYQPEDPLITEDKAMIEAIKTNNKNLIRSSYEDALKTLAFTLAANKSIETGRIEKVEI